MVTITPVVHPLPMTSVSIQPPFRILRDSPWHTSTFGPVSCPALSCPVLGYGQARGLLPQAFIHWSISCDWKDTDMTKAAGENGNPFRTPALPDHGLHWDRIHGRCVYIFEFQKHSSIESTSQKVVPNPANSTSPKHLLEMHTWRPYRGHFWVLGSTIHFYILYNQ